MMLHSISYDPCQMTDPTYRPDANRCVQLAKYSIHIQRGPLYDTVMRDVHCFIRFEDPCEGGNGM